MRRLGILSRKTQSQYGQPRRRVGPIWRRPIRSSIFIFLLIILVGLGSGWTWKIFSIQVLEENARRIFIADSEKVGFAIKEISVRGRIETNKKTLLSTLSLKRGTPIFAFDPNVAIARLIALPWISTAIVERQLPDLIYITLVERVPLALWQNNGKFNLIATSG